MTWRYRAGQHWAVVGPRSAALVLDPSALGLAERIWGLVGGSADIDAVVEALAREGLAHLPAFALVEQGEDSVRVLVRGAAQVRLRTAGSEAEQVVDARGVRSWREDVVPSVAGILLCGPPSADGADPGPHLPLVGGIVRCSDLSLAAEEGMVPVALLDPVRMAAVPVTPVPVAAVPLTDAPAAAPEPPQPPEPSPEAAPVVDAALTLDEAAYELDTDPEPAEPAAAEDAVAPAADELGEEEPGQEDGAVDDEYLEWVSGATRLGSVEDAAVREGADDAVAEAAPPPPPAQPPVTTQIPVVAPPPGRAPARPTRGAADAPRTLISSVPFGTARTSAPPAPQVPGPGHGAPQPGGAEEEAELTLARVPSGDGGRSAAGEPRVGWLPSVVCDRGHANPPESERCRICGADLADAEHRWVESPAIGVLRFAGPPGTVPLSARTVVIGRAPRVDGVSGDALPDLVVVPNASGDISRSHVRVEVQGWHVMVVDLHARNGTVVVDPGGESRRLHPGEEKMIVPGTRVVLSDDVQFVFEAQA